MLASAQMVVSGDLFLNYELKDDAAKRLQA